MDYEKLNAFIDDSGISKSDIAQKLDLSRQSFYKRLSGEISFTQSEVCRLAMILRMTEDEIMTIFFADWVSKFAH